MFFKRRKCHPQDYFEVATTMNLDDVRKTYVKRIFNHVSENLKPNGRCCFRNNKYYLKTIRQVDIEFRKDFFFPHRRGFAIVCRLDDDCYYHIGFLSIEQLKELEENINKMISLWNM